MAWRKSVVTHVWMRRYSMSKTRPGEKINFTDMLRNYVIRVQIIQMKWKVVYANNIRLEKCFIQYKCFVYANILIVPYYTMPISFCGKLISKIGHPLEHLSIKLPWNRMTFYNLVTKGSRILVWITQSTPFLNKIAWIRTTNSAWIWTTVWHDYIGPPFIFPIYFCVFLRMCSL